MEARYRSDYAGEFIITETKWINGHKEQTREWVDNPIINQHISGRAACIGSNTDLWQFDYSILQRHRGGLLGSKKLQTYGTGPIAKQMRLDFAVESDKNVLPELIDSGYAADNVVYTTGINCVKFPALADSHILTLPTAETASSSESNAPKETTLIDSNW